LSLFKSELQVLAILPIFYGNIEGEDIILEMYDFGNGIGCQLKLLFCFCCSVNFPSQIENHGAALYEEAVTGL
jgi:hypothetical protein